MLTIFCSDAGWKPVVEMPEEACRAYRSALDTMAAEEVEGACLDRFTADQCDRCLADGRGMPGN